MAVGLIVPAVEGLGAAAAWGYRAYRGYCLYQGAKRLEEMSKAGNKLLNEAKPEDCTGNCEEAQKKPERNPAKDAESGKDIDPADKDGKLTKSGRALQKHGSRSGSAFPQAKGNPEAINEQGQGILDGIANDPGSTIKEGNRFGGYDISSPSGRGARFDGEGKFRGFLEP